MAGYFKIGLIATAVLAAIPLLLPRIWNRGLVGVLLACGLLTMGAGEWLREAGRKPFVIQGYMYSTGMLVQDEGKVEQAGMTASARWISPAAAEDRVSHGRGLFLAYCQPCHTMDGYNGLRPFLARWNSETVASLVPRTQHLRALMPPWYGTETENEALTTYLMSRKPAETAALPDDPDAAAKVAFNISCGLCHTVSGYRPLKSSFAGQSAKEIDEFLDAAGDMVDEMPAYFGDDRQREALVRFLKKMEPEASPAKQAAAPPASDERRES